MTADVVRQLVWWLVAMRIVSGWRCTTSTHCKKWCNSRLRARYRCRTAGPRHLDSWWPRVRSLRVDTVCVGHRYRCDGCRCARRWCRGCRPAVQGGWPSHTATSNGRTDSGRPPRTTRRLAARSHPIPVPRRSQCPWVAPRICNRPNRRWCDRGTGRHRPRAPTRTGPKLFSDSHPWSLWTAVVASHHRLPAKRSARSSPHPPAPVWSRNWGRLRPSSVAPRTRHDNLPGKSMVEPDRMSLLTKKKKKRKSLF